MSGRVALTREQVLGHRAQVQGLHGVGTTAEVELLAIGLPDTPAGSAELGLGHRVRPVVTTAESDLVLALTVRGAPHLHRRTDLPALRAALVPTDDAEFRALLGGHGTAIVESGVDGPELVEATAIALRMALDAAGGTATKAELSARVSQDLPEPAVPWCEPCGTRHVAEGLFRVGTLLAGIELAPTGRRQGFRAGPPVIQVTDHEGALVELLRRWLTLTGPAVLADAVRWLDTRARTSVGWLTSRWRALGGDLVEVAVDGITGFVHAADLDAIRTAAPPPAALLLPPRDAYLNGSRSLLVPDRVRARKVWRPVGSPGVLVLAGEVAGTWRSQVSGRTITITVTPFARPRAGVRAAVSKQAALIAYVRGHNTLEPVVEWAAPPD